MIEVPWQAFVAFRRCVGLHGWRGALTLRVERVYDKKQGIARDMHIPILTLQHSRDNPDKVRQACEDAADSLLLLGVRVDPFYELDAIARRDLHGIDSDRFRHSFDKGSYQQQALRVAGRRGDQETAPRQLREGCSIPAQQASDAADSPDSTRPLRLLMKAFVYLAAYLALAGVFELIATLWRRKYG